MEGDRNVVVRKLVRSLTARPQLPVLRAVARNSATPFPVLEELMRYTLGWSPELFLVNVKSEGTDSYAQDYNDFHARDLPAFILYNESLTVTQQDDLISMIVETVNQEAQGVLLDFMFTRNKRGNLGPAYRLLQACREAMYDLERLVVSRKWEEILRETVPLPVDILEQEWEEVKTPSLNHVRFAEIRADLLLKQPACTERMLVEACRHSEERIRLRASQHPNCPETSSIEVILRQQNLVKGTPPF